MPFNEQQGEFIRLRQYLSERLRDVAVWTGAGVSAPSGLPTWQQLRAQLCEEAGATIASLSGIAPEVGGAPEIVRLSELLREAQRSDDLWEAFENLKLILGDASFVSSIRQKFEHFADRAPPALYQELWRLPGVSTMMTLNIDNFAERSHGIIRGREESVISFVGKNAHQYSTLLKRRRPFIANLHGLYPAEDTWVFTKSDISTLLKHRGYVQFINSFFYKIS